MKKKIVLIVGVLVVAFVGLLILLSEDVLSDEEMKTARKEVDVQINDLALLEIDIINLCEVIYDEESNEECEDYYEGIKDVKSYIESLRDILDENDNVLREPYFESKSTIKQSLEAVENAKEDLNEIKELKDLEKEISEKIVEENKSAESEVIAPTPSVKNKPPKSEEKAPAPSTTNTYEKILNQYTAKLKRECPTLSMMECAEISNEGMVKMAEYMYTAKGTDGQYATYEKWAGKLIEVYMQEAR